MRAGGIIVEYNPFHNGHKIHLKSAKEGNDIVVAVMSGNFLQRGEPAIYNKWCRAEMALENGVDIVLELPVFYSNQSAEIFSNGAVDILDRLGVESIVFGSESKDIAKLTEIANLHLEKKDILDEKIRIELDKGISYPNAMNNIIEELLGEKEVLKPNDILGIEYIKSIQKINSTIKPILVKRKGSGYHDLKIKENIASATSIRNIIKEGRDNELGKLIPKKSLKLLDTPTYFSDFYPLLRYEILTNYHKLKNIVDMEVGLENRIFENAIKYDEFNEFYKNVMTKRYTNARMQRVLSHILLKIDKELLDKTKNGVTYVKLLGASTRGREYLKKKKEDINIKILSGLKNVSVILNHKERELLNFELTCDRVYNIINPYKDKQFPIVKR